MLKFKKPESTHTVLLSYDKYHRINDIIRQQNMRLLEEVAKKYRLDYDQLVEKYVKTM